MVDKFPYEIETIEQKKSKEYNPYEHYTKELTVPEFNDWYRKKWERAYSVVNCIDNAIRRAGKEMKTEMDWIGWNDDVKHTLNEALYIFDDIKRHQTKMR